MNDDDYEEEGVDDYLDIVNAKLAAGVKFGVAYFKMIHRQMRDQDLGSSGPQVEAFFRNIYAYMDKNGQNKSKFSKLSTLDGLVDFGFPVEDEICYGILLQIIENRSYNDRERSPVADEYASDDFEEFDEDVKPGRSTSSEDQYHHQNKVDIDMELFEGEVTYKTPAPSSEPKLNSGVPRNDHKLQVLADAKDADSRRRGSATGARASKDVPSSSQMMRSSSTGGKRRNPAWISEQRWTLSDKIGEGAFGQVYKCLDDMGRIFAVKVQKIGEMNNQQQIASLANEISLMRELIHPNIVQYIGCKVDHTEQICYIFQQYCSGGSIAHVVEHMQKGKHPVFGFPEKIIRHYTQQILAGLCYLHENHIIHRDIKGGNILLDTNGVIKLADFGCSTSLDQLGETIKTKQMTGSPFFMAPEVFQSSYYGRRGDVWAVGCTIIQMITGNPPWRDRNVNLIQLGLIVQNWNEGPPPVLDYSKTPLCPKQISPALRDLLEQCFVKDNKHRPFPLDLLQCEFLQEEDVEDSLEYSHDDMDAGMLGDRLAESLTIEEQLSRASSSQQHGRPNRLITGGVASIASNNIDSDDSIGNYIENRLPQSRPAPIAPSTPTSLPNPFSSNRPPSSVSPVTPVSSAAGPNPFSANSRPNSNARRPSPAFPMSPSDEDDSPTNVGSQLDQQSHVRRGSGGSQSLLPQVGSNNPSPNQQQQNPFSKRPSINNNNNANGNAAVMPAIVEDTRERDSGKSTVGAPQILTSPRSAGVNAGGGRLPPSSSSTPSSRATTASSTNSNNNNNNNNVISRNNSDSDTELSAAAVHVHNGSAAASSGSGQRYAAHELSATSALKNHSDYDDRELRDRDFGSRDRDRDRHRDGSNANTAMAPNNSNSNSSKNRLVEASRGPHGHSGSNLLGSSNSDTVDNNRQGRGTGSGTGTGGTTGTGSSGRSGSSRSQVTTPPQQSRTSPRAGPATSQQSRQGSAGQGSRHSSNRFDTWESNNNNNNNYDDNDEDTGPWECLNCHRWEDPTLSYCSYCAVRRGATGQKRATDQIFRSPT